MARVVSGLCLVRQRVPKTTACTRTEVARTRSGLCFASSDVLVRSFAKPPVANTVSRAVTEVSWLVAVST
jgi:hypothetical protein